MAHIVGNVDIIHIPFFCATTTPRTCSLGIPPHAAGTVWVQFSATSPAFITMASGVNPSPSMGVPLCVSGFGQNSEIYDVCISDFRAYSIAASTVSVTYAVPKLQEAGFYHFTE